MSFWNSWNSFWNSFWNFVKSLFELAAIVARPVEEPSQKNDNGGHVEAHPRTRVVSRTRRPERSLFLVGFDGAPTTPRSLVLGGSDWAPTTLSGTGHSPLFTTETVVTTVKVEPVKPKAKKAPAKKTKVPKKKPVAKKTPKKK